MLRAKTLLLFSISILLILISCSETTTDPEEGGEGEEPIEPTASVSNPSDGDNLEGEITFAIDGESENGFDEARIFIGEEQVETVEAPNLPYEQTIATYDYNNGDYDLSAELDIAEEDTTIEASISVTLENYLVELQTDGFIASLTESTDATYLFIADPAGNVLREIELTSRSDGNIQLLPPAQLDGEVLAQFSITLGYQYTSDEGQQLFELNTHTGFKSWSDVSLVAPASESSGNNALLAVDYYNYPEEYYLGYGQDANYGVTNWFLRPSQPDSLPVTNSSDEAIISLLPADEGITQYYRETSLQDSLNASGSLTINVAENFQDYSVKSLSLPNGYRYASGQPFLQGENSFSDGYYTFQEPSSYGREPASDEALLAYPDISNRTVGYVMQLSSNSDNSIVAERIGDQESMPSEFTKIDAEATITNNSLDGVQLDITGSADFVYLNAGSSQQSWSVWFPDTTENVVFPFIADSLNPSVTVYNRSDLRLNAVELWDLDAYDGYSEYLNAYYGQTAFELPFNYRYWYKNLSSDQNNVSPLHKKIRKQEIRSGELLQVPTTSQTPEYLDKR